MILFVTSVCQHYAITKCHLHAGIPFTRPEIYHDQCRNQHLEEQRWCSSDRTRSGRVTAEQTLHWRHNDHNGVSNTQPPGCLLNRLLRRRSKKTSKLRVTGLYVGNLPGPVNSPHKGPVTQKMFLNLLTSSWNGTEQTMDRVHISTALVFNFSPSFGWFMRDRCLHSPYSPSEEVIWWKVS